MNKLVMVSGYFDPIHPGHIMYLREAKKLGDILIVVIDGDQRCVAKKGKPFMPAVDRREVLKAIKYVDKTYIEKVDVKNSLKRFMPDVFVKSGDRAKPEDIPEYELCIMLGIDVEIVAPCDENNQFHASNYLQDWVDFKNSV